MCDLKLNIHHRGQVDDPFVKALTCKSWRISDGVTRPGTRWLLHMSGEEEDDSLTGISTFYWIFFFFVILNDFFINSWLSGRSIEIICLLLTSCHLSRIASVITFTMRYRCTPFTHACIQRNVPFFGSLKKCNTNNSN